MEIYPGLNDALVRMPIGSTDWQRVVAILVGHWIDQYCRSSSGSDIVETRATDFSYLFDITGERLIAAWGVGQGRHGEPRPASRMKGHPLGASDLYHRGHAIPHTLGGGTDINLVAQLGRINIGPFRVLERKAVATPGSLYFTSWHYAPGRASQVPRSVDQGLLIAGRHAVITRHGN